MLKNIRLSLHFQLLALSVWISEEVLLVFKLLLQDQLRHTGTKSGKRLEKLMDMYPHCNKYGVPFDIFTTVSNLEKLSQFLEK